MNDILTVSEHQKILVSSIRNIKNNTISYEDKELLFNVTYQDQKRQTRYIVSRNGNRGNEIKVNSIVGSVSLKTGLTLEILPKFAKNNLDKENIKKHRKMLLNILRVANEKNFISSASQSAKLMADEMPLLHYVIELFSIELLHTLRSGTYATYTKKVENSSHIRGNILISKTIQNNIIDKSKVYHSYQKHSSNNLLMQIFRSLSKILLNDNNLSYKAKQTLHEIYLLLDEVDIIPLKTEDFKFIIFNRLNDKFEILFTQAEFIFNQYMPFTSHINSIPFWAILFDMNYLFEKFCAYLLRCSDISTHEQSTIKCFTDIHKSVSAKPDFILSNDVNIIVADAKWKLLSRDKSIYGLDAQNFWQLFSYMNLVSENEQVHGYFIVPKNNNDFEDEIIFTPIQESNKSISILSIDFSLDFEELIDRYQFEIINGVLKLKIKVIEEKIEIIEEKEEAITKEEDNKEFKFNLKDFINELEILSNNKNIRKNLSPSKKNDKFKNLYYLKEKYNANSKSFNISIKDNLNKDSWSFDGLGIKDIPTNIIKFKNLHKLSLTSNNILLLSENIFKLSKLILLDITDNNNLILPSNILDSKSLKVLLLDKKVVENNILLLEKLNENNVIIKDENNENLSKYIESIINKDIEKIDNDEPIEIEEVKIKKDVSEITLDEYRDMNKDEKCIFVEKCNFSLIDNDIIETIVNEEDIDILEDFTYNETLPLRYLLLTYNKNIDNKDINRLKENIEKNNISLYELIKLNIYNLTSHIENSFNTNTIDKEILISYAMTNITNFFRVRKKIAELTIDIEILDELSKNEEDIDTLYLLITKNNHHKRFQNTSSHYSKVILDRIAHYSQHYQFEDNGCLVTQLSQNYSLNDKTKEYLLRTYSKDKILLERLCKSYSNYDLKIRIENALDKLENTNEEKDWDKPMNSLESYFR